MIALFRRLLSQKYYILLFAFLCIAIGILSASRIKMTQMPHSEFPLIDIVIVYPNATQTTLRQSIAEPLQDRLSRVKEIENLRISINEAVFFGVQYRYGTDMDDAERELKEIIGRLKRSLPRQVQFQVKRSRVADKLNSFVIGISAKEGVSESALYAEASQLQHRLSLLPDATGVTLILPPKEVRIALDTPLLTRKGLSVSSIASALENEKKQSPPGHLTFGDQRFDVQLNEPYKTLADIAAVQIPSVHQDARYRLGDIAQLQIVPRENHEQQYRINGNPAYLIRVKTTASGNPFRLKKHIQNEISRPHDATQFSIQFLYDEAALVAAEMHGLGMSFLQGFLFLIVILVLFMGLRAGLIAAITMPLSILFTLAILPTTGHWLHAVSISGLIIAMGIIVDNGIVVAESVDMFADRDDLSLSEKAIQGAAAVTMPLLTSTLSTVFAFGTILFLNTEEGVFIRSLSLTIILALIASYFISILFATLLLSIIPPKPKARPPQQGPAKKPFLTFDYFRSLRDTVFPKTVAYCIRHPFQVLGGLALIFALTLYTISRIPNGEMPPENSPYAYVDILIKNKVDIATTDALVRNIEKKLRAFPEIQHITTVVGGNFPQVHLSMVPIYENPSNARIFIQTNITGISKHIAFVDKLNTALSSHSETHSVTARQFTRASSGSMYPIALFIKSRNLEELFAFSPQLAEKIAAIPGVRSVYNRSQGRDPYRVSVDIDSHAVLAQQVSLAEARQTLGFVTTGLQVDTFTDAEGTAYPMVLRVSGIPENPMAILNTLPLRSTRGHDVRLSDVVHSRQAPPERLLQYHNHMPATRLDIQVDPGASVPEIQARIEQLISAAHPPKSLQFTFTGQLADRKKNVSQFLTISYIAIFLIFALFAVEFKSFVHPLYVFTAIPLSLVGGVLMLHATGESFSLLAFLGFTSLFGLAVNDAVLLVDKSNVEIQAGKPLFEACIDAATHRFFPIILTSITTIIGLLPLTFGENLFRPMAIVILGGLTSSTLLLLLVIPTLIYWVERRRTMRHPG